ncbi:MAG TPA: excisionase family DNA-binding protein [Oscillospiraceae bacterium]|nr:excisionase family DNA-binding protein [Oscillospiraceae bacterium]
MEKMTISVQELSERLGISLPKAYELTKSAGFPVLRVGTRVLIPVEELKAWIAENAVTSDDS